MIELFIAMVFFGIMVYALFFKISSGRKSARTLWMGAAFIFLALAIGLALSTKYTGVIMLLGIANVILGTYQMIDEDKNKK